MGETGKRWERQRAREGEQGTGRPETERLRHRGAEGLDAPWRMSWRGRAKSCLKNGGIAERKDLEAGSQGRNGTFWRFLEGNWRFLALFGDLMVCNSFVSGGYEIIQCVKPLLSTKK